MLNALPSVSSKRRWTLAEVRWMIDHNPDYTPRMVLSREEGRRLRRDDIPVRTLMLAIEVLSPSSEYGDRGPKRRLYQRHVPECWLVDLDARHVERWRPGDERPEILREQFDWMPPGATEPLVLDLRQIVREAGLAGD